MRAIVAIAVLLLAGCSQPSVGGCTQIGAVSGVSVTVERTIAAGVDNVVLRLCYDDRCKDVPVNELYPGSDTVPQDCPSAKDPDTTCSATAVPNGTMVGFVEVADLPEGAITASAKLTVGGKKRSLSKINVTATVVYPNGKVCPPMANQAQLTIGPDGLTAR
jgi:hypothetical protein